MKMLHQLRGATLELYCLATPLMQITSRAFSTLCLHIQHEPSFGTGSPVICHTPPSLSRLLLAFLHGDSPSDETWKRPESPRR
jgi:hypothetical protein